MTCRDVSGFRERVVGGSPHVHLDEVAGLAYGLDGKIKVVFEALSIVSENMLRLCAGSRVLRASVCLDEQ